MAKSNSENWKNYAATKKKSLVGLTPGVNPIKLKNLSNYSKNDFSLITLTVL